MSFDAPAFWRRAATSGPHLPALSWRAWLGIIALAALAYILARAPLPLAAAGIAACVLVLATLLEPALGLIGAAAAIPIANAFPMPLPLGLNATDLLVGLSGLAWLARGLAHRNLRLRAPALTWPTLILLWIMGLSMTQAESWRLGLPEWLKWVEFAVVYLLASELLDRRRIAWLLLALFGAGMIEVGQGAYQFLRQVGPEEFVLMGRFMRAYGAFSQPNPYAGYLGYLAPVAASLALGSLSFWWAGRAGRQDPPAPADAPTRHKALLWAVVYGTVAVSLGAGIMMSWSRGAWFGLAAALLVIATLPSQRAGPIFAVALGALGLVLLTLGTSWLPAPIASRLADLDLYSAGVDVAHVEVTDANFAVLERLGHWQAGLDMFSDHPWLGVGIGNYGLAYATYARPHFYVALGHAHNIYINFLAETGALGLAAFAAFWLAAFRLAWRRSRRTSRFSSALAMGVLGTLVFLTVHNLFDNVFVAHMQLQLALLLAAITVD